MDDVWLPSTRGLVHCKARLVEKRLQARAREVGDGSAPAQMPARDATVASPAAALGSAGWQVMGPGYT